MPITGNNILIICVSLQFKKITILKLLTSIRYTESLYALVSFAGMYYLQKKNFLLSSLIFGLASATRGNGILYCGFFIFSALTSFSPFSSNWLFMVTPIDHISLLTNSLFSNLSQNGLSQLSIVLLLFRRTLHFSFTVIRCFVQKTTRRNFILGV